MAGGHMKYRTLGRDSAHRQALLRNLVTSLIKNETIHTTWPKAKEAQRLAEKLITLAKRDNEETRRKAQAILFTPHDLLPKLFGEIRQRYLNRPGGYTRVLRTEPKVKAMEVLAPYNKNLGDPFKNLDDRKRTIYKYDQAPSAILELVDGPTDMRFAITAAAIARDRRLNRDHSELTLRNRTKVTQFRLDGEAQMERMVRRVSKLHLDTDGQQLDMVGSANKNYPKPKDIRDRKTYWPENPKHRDPVAIRTSESAPLAVETNQKTKPAYKKKDKMTD